jgi:hypothetical protein
MTVAPDKTSRIGRSELPIKQVYSPASARHKAGKTATSRSAMRCSSRQLRNGLILANMIGWLAIMLLIWRLFL